MTSSSQDPSSRPSPSPQQNSGGGPSFPSRRRPHGRGGDRPPQQPGGPPQQGHVPPNVPAVTGPQPRDLRFGDLAISEPVMRAILELGYQSPTPIQQQAIPIMFQGVDLVGQAQTGTGKTAAFGIPIAERVDGGQRHIQAIVLTPTRELAQQVSAEIARICKHRGIRVVTLYGGQPIKKQLAELEHGVHVVVGTPGRIIDHIDRGTIKLGQVSIVVLDEADLMLDYGFFPDIRRILRFIPGRRQIALFTATVPTPIKNLIHNYLHQPKHIQVGASAKPVEEVRQLYYEVADRDKIAGLMEVLHGGEHDQALIFCRTQGRVDMVAERLSRRGFAIQGIHGGMEQKNRDAAMNAFRDGSLKLLVATNVAARGLDIAAVSNVINFDIPESVEDYVHRIGRTARMGREGTAITFVSEWDMPAFEAIKKHVGAEKIERRDLKLYQR